ncbi:hypothetical protein VR7878_03856 [Vibrio ruber DSM 16370]|uniref:DUF4123 domain-containing protein n=1 Tax=Vibrio ruber (strain DSM 16370 / JCM 11486 / BCRC 17186 / CECT 7878 / LMG 23124 / VR1) TaxID=1123498 RepID=A0A1R4LTN5_VIBR1|nr:DUF4123 domain-containing protein [Vibrio ruber]SJN59956.1 hypothetical protein VR7878_03856 [Vibrio ruber DSM 16370]
MRLFPELQDSSLVHWLVVDSVRVPDITQLVYQYEKNVELYRLFAGTPFDHLIEQSPVAFRYSGVTEIERQLKEDFALRTSSVLFSCDPSVATESVIQHFQALLYVVVAESPILFRYYASPIWNDVAPETTAEDRCTLLGPCQALSWVDSQQNGHSLRQFPEAKIEADFQLPYHLQSPVFNALVEQRYG